MRALMVGGGERGMDLACALVADGHAVRVVTRRADARRAEIEGAGCELWPGDPDRIGTIRYGLENVTVVLWLLGTASGDDPERVGALHGSRLKMMLEKTTDTTVRGVVYETAGTVGEDAFATGRHEIEWAYEANEIPYAFLEADPRGDRGAWVRAARDAIDSLLGAVRAAPNSSPPTVL